MTTTETTWEMVIGLEVHCELQTATKLFCGCRNAFGDEPNVNICPTCLGLPGSLPVLNEQAVELAMRIGAALHCEICPSEFARKNYFYPDQAKDYQISQYDLPLNANGWLELPDGFRVGVTRAHMEEDTGKLTHIGASGRINAALHALVDYNRSGVPLVEIVSEPDIRTAAQARAYASELRGILVATGASDGRMEEGSMRVDANVSVRPVGTEAFGTRCEIKNLNSLRSLVRAIEYEAARQIALLESGDTVTQETRHWDESAGRTDSMRSKEEANDYRYFPEPDLVPLAPDAAWQEKVRAGLGSMPADRRAVLAGRARRGADRGRDGPDPRGRRPRSRRAGDGGRRGRRAGRPGTGPCRQRGRRPGPGRESPGPRDVCRRTGHGVRRSALGHAIEGRARRTARARWGRPGRGGQGDGLRGARVRHPRRRARRGHRRQPRRVGALRRRRRQVDGVLHGGGHEGHLGQGQREGSGGGATEPPRLTPARPPLPCGAGRR